MSKADFIRLAEQQFAGFLSTHDLKRERRRWSNAYSVSFTHRTSRLYLEGIHWGGSARAVIGTAGAEFESHDLLDVISTCCPQLMPSEQDLRSGQPRALEILARCAGQCPAVAEVMAGDFTLFPRFAEPRRQREEDYVLRFLSQRPTNSSR